MLLNEVSDKVSRLSDEQKQKSLFGITLLELLKTNFGRETRRKLLLDDHGLSDIPGATLLRKWLHYAPSEVGLLIESLNQVELSQATLKYAVRFIAVFDGQDLLAKDMKIGDTLTCSLDDLADNATFFAPLYGQERYIAAEESEIDRQATTQLGRIYDALVKANPQWAKKHTHDLNTFMTRLLFCLFAEDTGIFEKSLLSKTLSDRAGSHGEKMHEVIGHIFRILNTPENKRALEPKWLTDFPYVNGDVFDISDIEVPQFSPTAYRYFMAASGIDWGHVHADILGSSIQKIVDSKTRGELGMHYTSVSNIKKVIDPLFMDELRERLGTVRQFKNPLPELHKLLDRIGSIKVFDPACGSGNFLVVAYQSMRELEIDIINALSENGEKQISAFSRITLNNFYGIEYAEFASETAKIALRIVEYQMDEKYRKLFGTHGVTLPLRCAPHIMNGNSLRIDWSSFVGDGEVVICGNPPFLGDRDRDDEQRKDHDSIIGLYCKKHKRMDYLCNWFVLGKLFFLKNKKSRFAFVATNSVCQGIHLDRLWPFLLDGLSINFAHKSFKWGNLAGNNANVHCVIVGMWSDAEKKKIYDLNSFKVVRSIHPNLEDEHSVIVNAESKPISMLSEVVLGSAPKDGGFLLLNSNELSKCDEASKKYIRRFVGSADSLQGGIRYCIWSPESIPSSDAKFCLERISQVANFRLSSKAGSTKRMAEKPHRFVQLSSGYLSSNPGHLTILIPRHSSEKREFFPASALLEGEIVADSAMCIYNANLYELALISSKLHMLWLKKNGGRLEERLRYSSTLVWNTFPVPQLNDEQKSALSKAARDILRAREEYCSHLTLGDMYMPDKMPEELKAAHNKNDAIIERIFNSKGFRSDEERLAHLFERYAEMTKDKE